MTTLQTLARYVHGFDASTLSPSTYGAIRRALLDLTGVAMAGYATSAARAAREVALRHHAPGPVAIWFSGATLSAAGAAFANAAAASALDLDDGHRRAGGHPGASIIPAALSVAIAAGRAEDGAIFAAIALGYEIAVRISAARDFSNLDTLSTGRWCGYGAAAASAYLLRLGESETAHAMAIAGVVAPGLSASGYSRFMGNSVKEGIAFATAQGILAADLAARGYTGPLDILDHRNYFDSSAVLHNLGAPTAVREIYFKPYGCCRWIHSAIDAAIYLRERHGIDPGAIDSIHVETFSRALRLSNECAPATLEGAQYSLPFGLAAVLCDGAAALLPMRQSLLQRDDIANLARRVEMSVDSALDALFPAQAAARLTIRHRGEDLMHQVRVPLGEPDNPMSIEQLGAKFDRLTGATAASGDLKAHLLQLGLTTSFSSIPLDLPAVPSDEDSA